MDLHWEMRSTHELGLLFILCIDVSRYIKYICKLHMVLRLCDFSLALQVSGTSGPLAQLRIQSSLRGNNLEIPNCGQLCMRHAGL